MRTATPLLRFTAGPPTAVAGAHVWRPCPAQFADILCVDEAGGDVGPRIHARFAITVLPAPAVIRVESSRSVVADRKWVVLVPPSHLHAARIEDQAPGALTLLVGEPQLRGLGIPDRPALVPDAALGAELAALVARWRRPLLSLESVFATRSLLERLVARSTRLGPAENRRATPLLPVREYLYAHLGQPVPTADLAAVAELTECHLIRAFHMEFGLPPHAYHRRVRLAAAADLLARGMAVSAAAYECGFADQSHLSRKFKETYGLTPAAWATAAADARRHDAPTGETSAVPRSGMMAARAGEERRRAWAPAH